MSRLWHTDWHTYNIHVKVEQYSAEAESAIDKIILHQNILEFPGPALQVTWRSRSDDGDDGGNDAVDDAVDVGCDDGVDNRGDYGGHYAVDDGGDDGGKGDDAVDDDGDDFNFFVGAFNSCKL